MTAKIAHINNCNGQNKCPSCLKVVAIVGSIGNILIAFIKVLIGFSFGSIALIAGALYSLLDTGFCVLVLVGLKAAYKPPDNGHEFGHGKIESLIAVLFSLLILLGALAIFVLAIYELHETTVEIFNSYVLLVATISMGASYLFYRFTDCVATQLGSPSIRYLSVHSKSDAASSACVIASLAVTYCGYHQTGHIVAIIETLHLLVIGSEMFNSSLHGLLDASIPIEDLKTVKSILTTMHGIKNINYVKSRKVGHKVWLNIELELPASDSIAKVDEIKREINASLRAKIKNVEGIMVAVVPFRENVERELAVVASH
jgi:cation diffusion facilitator family transporter